MGLSEKSGWGLKFSTLEPPGVCVCRQKTRLFAVLPLENRHEIALYRSASQFIFFERCLESRTSLLSSAMAMGF